MSGIMEHLRAFQRIADANGGNRASGTKGYDASAQYVAKRMRAAGYRVRFQEFRFPYVVERERPRLRVVGDAGTSYRNGKDFTALGYSGSGRVEARAVAVDLLVPSPSANASTSGCEASDFASFPRSAVALLQRGTCTFRVKVANAAAAGASAVVVFNEGNPGRRALFAATLGPPQAGIPALSASFETGIALGRDGRARDRPLDRAAAHAERHRRQPARKSANLVVAGAHLDSVEDGPGINDNGSGSAVLLEAAEELAALRPRNRLRFTWWGAEEFGLIGSRHYVERLSAVERRRHALYLNLDMVGSPNYALLVYDGDGARAPAGSAAIERALRGYFTARRIPHRQTALGDRSDHAPFAAAGIAVGGLFTGADGRKSASEARVFGGRAGRPHDPCYHAPCDTLENVSRAALTRTGRAVAQTLERFARDVSAVRRAG